MMIGPRNRQEDCIIDGKGLLQADLLNRKNRVCTDHLVLAVCDGMGGHQGGEKASSFVCRHIEKIAWAEDISGLAVRRALIDIQAAAEQKLPVQSGTTIAGIATDGNRAVIFNAGDSRVYKITGRTIQHLSHDHSLVQDLVDRCMMKPENASLHPLKHMIDFGIGPAFKQVWPVRHLHIVELDIDLSCAYLLCTDGLTDIMSDDEIHRILAGTPVENGAGLAKAARKKA